MSVSLFTEHFAQALNRLLSQFKGKPRFEAVIKAFLDQIQEVENILNTLLNARTIDNASGDLLDIIGKIVGRPREGRDDNDYRVWLKSQLSINKSSGTAEELITVIQLITGLATSGTVLIEEFDSDIAYFRLTILTALGTIDPDVVKEIINSMRAAGVSTDLVGYLEEPLFRLDTGPGLDEGNLAGFF